LSHFLTVLRAVGALCDLAEEVGRATSCAYLTNHVHGDHLESLLKFSAGQWNTLVNFGSALCALAGQFWIGNKPQLPDGQGKRAEEPDQDHAEFESTGLPR
jgi:hypothetical protein